MHEGRGIYQFTWYLRSGMRGYRSSVGGTYYVFWFSNCFIMAKCFDHLIFYDAYSSVKMRSDSCLVAGLWCLCFQLFCIVLVECSLVCEYITLVFFDDLIFLRYVHFSQFLHDICIAMLEPMKSYSTTFINITSFFFSFCAQSC